MRRLSVWAICLFVVGSASAQKISGSISPLKSQKEVNVVLDFSGTLVNGKSEEKYIAESTKSKNQTEKAKWMKEWNEDLRSQAYSMLTNDLNKHLKASFKVGNYPDAEYTMHIKVKEIKTGIALVTNSSVKANVRVIKKGGSVPIATVDYKKSTSKISGNVPYFVTRTVMSFGKLGDDIAKTVNKNLK